MSPAQPKDLTRQFANVLGAFFQIYASYTVGNSVGVIAQEFRSLIIPATYAFAIWGPIFVLCAAFALYQALPAQRENPIFRAIGWWTAAAFVANGAWSYAFASRHFVLAQAIIVAGLVFAGGAYLRYARAQRSGQATSIARWLIGPALGLLFGWITAANIAGLAATLIARGFAATGQGAALGGAALLLCGAAVAFFVIVVSRQAPDSLGIAYGGAAIWAFIAVAMEQRQVSTLTSVTAAGCALLVLLALFGRWSLPARPLGSPTPA